MTTTDDLEFVTCKECEPAVRQDPRCHIQASWASNLPADCHWCRSATKAGWIGTFVTPRPINTGRRVGGCPDVRTD